jgi:hypothetical protein
MIPIIFLTFLMIWSPSNASSSSEVCAVTEERLSELLYEDENMRLDDPRVRRQKKETAEIERRILNRLTPPPVATFENVYDSMRQSLDEPHKCGMRNNTSLADCTHYIGILTSLTRDEVEYDQRYFGADYYDYMQPCFSGNPNDPDDNTYYWYVFFTTLFNHTHTPQSYDHHKQWGMLLRR